jgi:hypothetical protein
MKMFVIAVLTVTAIICGAAAGTLRSSPKKDP